jgi:hypothetical protein
MAQEKKTGGRFAGLRTLREQRMEEPEELTPDTEITDANPVIPPVVVEEQGQGISADHQEPAMVEQKAKQTPLPKTDVLAEEEKRGPGRPRGRRSNPNYTQVSAYIPLDMLLEVQDALAEERKQLRRRTPRPVSDLLEELLGEWLLQRKAEKRKVE